MSNSLECTVNYSGTPFKVLKTIKNNTYHPESIGFNSYIMGPENNNPNIIYRKSIIIRRGKKGKDRLENIILKTPIFRTPKFIEKLSNKELMISDNLIDIEIDKNLCENVFKYSDLLEVDLNVIGWFLSKGLFITELDKIAYSTDHKIVEKIGVVEQKNKRKFWKNGVFKNFIRNIEDYFANETYEDISIEFTNPISRHELIKYIRKAEIYLSIPYLEYQKRINLVLLNALDYLKNKVEKDKEVLNSIREEKILVEKNIKSIELDLEKKLDKIVKNRIVLNM